MKIPHTLPNGATNVEFTTRIDRIGGLEIDGKWMPPHESLGVGITVIKEGILMRNAVNCGRNGEDLAKSLLLDWAKDI